MSWRDKANREIAKLCLASWRQANVKADGTIRKRHVPYAVPELAQTLVDCLKRDDEQTAKAIFVWELA